VIHEDRKSKKRRRRSLTLNPILAAECGFDNLIGDESLGLKIELKEMLLETNDRDTKDVEEKLSGSKSKTLSSR
jgi:hypothetical protein